MKFEIDADSIKDMIALYGKEYAINEMVSSFRAGIETVIEALEEGEKNESSNMV